MTAAHVGARTVYRRYISFDPGHYADGLVDGAFLLGLFGDVATDLSIQLDGDEGLLAGYSDVRFHTPVRVGDVIEAEGTVQHLPGLSCQPEPDGTVHRNVHVALGGRDKDRPGLVVPGRPGRAIEPVPGDARTARWEVPVTLRRGDGGFDFSGPFVGGDRTDRNLGLAWGDVPGDGTLRLFRGAKLGLVDVDPGIIEEAMRPGWRLVARVRLTDAKGNPVCARIRPPALTWSADPAE